MTFQNMNKTGIHPCAYLLSPENSVVIIIITQQDSLVIKESYLYITKKARNSNFKKIK